MPKKGQALAPPEILAEKRRRIKEMKRQGIKNEDIAKIEGYKNVISVYHQLRSLPPLRDRLTAIEKRVDALEILTKP